jgi:hypothetical protein
MNRIDLDMAERVINRPHVIELRDDGWTIMHPPRCHPSLFDCPVNKAAVGMDDPGLRGQYECWLTLGDVFDIGSPIEDAPGIDWAALVVELRVAREALDLLRPARAKIRQLLDDQGLRGDLPASIRQTLRQVHAYLDGAVAAYDQPTQDEGS